MHILLYLTWKGDTVRVKGARVIIATVECIADGLLRNKILANDIMANAKVVGELVSGLVVDGTLVNCALVDYAFFLVSDALEDSALINECTGV